MKRAILAIAAIGVLVVSCDKKEGEPLQNRFSGKVVNSITQALPNTKVRLIKSGSVYSETTTDADGAFLFVGAETGYYSIRLIKTGYLSDEIPSFELKPQYYRKLILNGLASVRGRIINAQTGKSVPNAVLLFSMGDTIAGNSGGEFRIQTDSLGTFEAERLPTGTFCNSIIADGFIRQFRRGVVLSEGENDLNNITITPLPDPGAYRIVLTWGATPRDLDGIVTGPKEGSSDRYRVYYGSRVPAGGNAKLDNESGNGYGPEAITILTSRPGMYRYSVFNYSDRTFLSSAAYGIKNSPAYVEIFNHEGLLASFNPPAPISGVNTWRVFELNIVNATSATVNPVNTWHNCEYSNAGHFRMDVHGKPDIFTGETKGF